MVQGSVFIAATGKETTKAMTNGAASPQYHPLKAGLEDVIVSTSEICIIDGQKGRLLYRGFDVDDLVAHSSFEEVVYLLDRKSTRLNSSHVSESRMPSSA